MAVAKLFPFRRGDQLLFRGKVIGSDVSVFKPFRRGNQMLLRGKNGSGDVILGWPYRKGNQLLARTIVSGEPEGCCYYDDGGFTYQANTTEAECDGLDGQWFPEDSCDTVQPPDTVVCGCVEKAEEGVWRFADKAIVELEGFEGWARGYTYGLACGEEGPWDCAGSPLYGDGIVMQSDAWRIQENWNEINGSHVLDEWYITALPGQDTCYWAKSWEIEADECRCDLPCNAGYDSVGVTIFVYVGADYWRKPDGEVWEYIYVECDLRIGFGSYQGLDSGSGSTLIMANYGIPEDAIDDESGFPTSYGSRIIIGTRKFLNSDLSEVDPEDRYTECQKPPYGPVALTWVVGPPPLVWCEEVGDPVFPYWPFEGSVTPPTATIRLYWITD